MGFLGQVFEGLKSLNPSAQRDILSLGEALPRLVPKVRPRFHFESLALRSGVGRPLFRPLAGTFAQSLVVDAPDWEVDVSQREMEAWGADFDILLQKARANLLLRGGEERFKQVRPGLYRSTWQDGLDGSRILLPGMIKGLRLQGDPVVVLPNRDTLLVAGSEDPRALGWILEAALEFLHEDPQAMNCCPLRWEGYQWEPWEARDDHPAAPLLQRVRRRRLLEEYARQKTLLDRIHGSEGKDVAVAPFHLERTASGAVRSCTILPSGAAEGWLPEADRVGLLPFGASGTCVWIPWDLVKRRLGHLLEPVGLFPERYRIRATPGLLDLAMSTGA